jgi:hypothetical protein
MSRREIPEALVSSLKNVATALHATFGIAQTAIVDASQCE